MQSLRTCVYNAECRVLLILSCTYRIVRLMNGDINAIFYIVNLKLGTGVKATPRLLILWEPFSDYGRWLPGSRVFIFTVL